MRLAGLHAQRLWALRRSQFGRDILALGERRLGQREWFWRGAEPTRQPLLRDAISGIA